MITASKPKRKGMKLKVVQAGNKQRNHIIKTKKIGEFKITTVMLTQYSKEIVNSVECSETLKVKLKIYILFKC